MKGAKRRVSQFRTLGRARIVVRIALTSLLCHDVTHAHLPRRAMIHAAPTHSHVNSGSLLTYRFFTLIWVLCVFSFGVHAQESYDPKAIYSQIKSLGAKKSRLDDEHYRNLDDNEKRKLEKGGTWAIIGMGCFTDECNATSTLKSKLTVELLKRGEADPVSAFYAGLLDLENAQEFQNSTSVTALTEFIERLSKDARRRFTFASSAGIAAASWNMGVIYATNLGVIGSKLAAIEWYGRAGHQYLKDGERETALAALEKMETMELKHPDSIRLREALYPATKKK